VRNNPEAIIDVPMATAVPEDGPLRLGQMWLLVRAEIK